MILLAQVVVVVVVVEVESLPTRGRPNNADSLFWVGDG